jgi:hypothetical protein
LLTNKIFSFGPNKIIGRKQVLFEYQRPPKCHMNEIKSSTRKSFEQKKGQNAALFACAVSVVKEGRE